MKSNEPFLSRVKSKAIYKDCFSKHLIAEYKSQYIDAMSFFNHFWEIYNSYALSNKLNNQVPGNAFEIIFAFILDYENIEISSMDEKIGNLDFVKPDFVIKKNNTFISCKTSLRERWKQADWESIKFKEIFPESKCYLITNHYKEYLTLRNKISKLDIDKVYYSASNDINLLIKEIK